jgi:hypothetical protein
VCVCVCVCVQGSQILNIYIQLRDYYQNAMGRLDNNQKLEAQDRIKEEERKTMLQSSVRVVAGQLDDIKTSYSNLKLLMLQVSKP